MSESAEPSPAEGSVRVVGTAHVSADSVAEVEQVIDDKRPDVVAVELDEGRYRQLKGETPDNLDASDLLHGNTVFQFLAYWLLSYIQTRMGERFDIKPGADMMAAVETAESLGINVALVDRDIQVTIQRFWARMTFLEKLRMLWQLTVGLAGFGDEAEDIDMDDLTNADVVTAMMAEFRRFSPGGAEALIDERDAFIAHRLVALREQGFDVVAIVGAGHRAGILGYLENPATLPPMQSLVGVQKKRFSVYKAFGYLFTLGFLVFFILLAMAGARNGFLLELFVAFFLINGIFSFTLAKLAGAHWSSATVGGAVAWMTSVNPLLAPGWFSGYVELRYTSVNITDIGKLNDILSDEDSPMGELWSRMKAVPLFRLILIVAMTNIGSMIASVLFAFVVLPYMAADVGGIDGVARLMVQGAENSADLILRQFT
ncbi:TraB/GumN family protein [Haladaptatus sp. ZSTT2]|uniref:TraB/GumN family protein n=1 Tax=Haladaptatus sp. ZSTT2 TaxID=3120515 RepID=UPI00300F1A4C